MTRTPTAPTAQNLIIGTFLVLAAALVAVAPLPLLVRSLGIVAASYAAFAFGGLPFAFAAALLAPVGGLLTGGDAWLVMLPLLLSSGLLALLGLDYAWRYPAILVSPLLYITPQLAAWQLSQRSLFAVELPWTPSAEVWLALHALTAFLGVAAAAALARWRESRERRPQRRRA